MLGEYFFSTGENWYLQLFLQFTLFADLFHYGLLPRVTTTLLCWNYQIKSDGIMHDCVGTE